MAVLVMHLDKKLSLTTETLEETREKIQTIQDAVEGDRWGRREIIFTACNYFYWLLKSYRHETQQQLHTIEQRLRRLMKLRRGSGNFWIVNAKGIRGIGSNCDKPLQAETPRITQFLSRPQPVYSLGQRHTQTVQEGRKTTSSVIQAIQVEKNKKKLLYEFSSSSFIEKSNFTDTFDDI